MGPVFRCCSSIVGQEGCLRGGSPLDTSPDIRHTYYATKGKSMTRSCPPELNTHLLTRSEMGAMLEHLFYHLKGKYAPLAECMPDAYQRLTGVSDGTMSTYLTNSVEALCVVSAADDDVEQTELDLILKEAQSEEALGH